MGNPHLTAKISIVAPQTHRQPRKRSALYNTFAIVSGLGHGESLLATPVRCPERHRFEEVSQGNRAVVFLPELLALLGGSQPCSFGVWGFKLGFLRV